MDKQTILAAISSTEPTGFSEFCQALSGDCPERGDREGWSDLFRILGGLERNGYVTIERDGRNIESLQLTESGASLAKAGKVSRPLRPGEVWKP